MKKLQYVMIALSAVILWQCGDKDIEVVGGGGIVSGAEDINFTADNLDVYIKDADVVSTLNFSTASNVTSDVAIALTTDGGEAGRTHSLVSDNVVVEAGSDSATGGIVFSKNMFDGVSGDEMFIKVRANTKQGALRRALLEYCVRRYFVGAPEITITADSTMIELYPADVVVTLTVSSNMPVPKPLTFTLATDGGTESVDFSIASKSVTIPQGEKEVTTTITFLKSSFVDANTERDGDLPGDKRMDIGVRLSTDSQVNYVKRGVVMSVMGGYLRQSYCKPTVGTTKHHLHTFTVGDYIFDPPHEVDQYFNYSNLINNAEYPLKKIEIPTGMSPLTFYPESMNVPGGGFYCLAWIDWNRDGDFADEGENVARIPYTAAYADNGISYVADLKVPDHIKPGFSTIMRIGVAEAAGKLNTDGCIDAYGDIMDVRIHIVQGKDPIVMTGNLTDESVRVSGTNVTKTITATLPGNATEDVVVNVTVKGGDTDKYSLASNTITIAKGARSGSTSITFFAEGYPSSIYIDSYIIQVEAKNKYKYSSGAGTKATYTVSGAGDKPVISLSAESVAVTVETGVDKVVTLQVKLSQADNSKAVVANLILNPAYADLATLEKTQVAFTKGQATPVPVKVTFNSKYFLYKGNVSIPISVESNDALVHPTESTYTFMVQGSAPKPGSVTVKADEAPAAGVSVSNGDASLTYKVYLQEIVTNTRYIRLTLDDASKATFANGSTTYIMTFTPESPRYYEWLVLDVKINFHQTGFVPNVDGQTVALKLESFGSSNLDFGSGATSLQRTIKVVRRTEGTYCPISGSVPDNFSIESITIGSTTVTGPFTATYTDRSATEIPITIGSKFLITVTVKKAANVADAIYYGMSYYDYDGDYEFLDSNRDGIYIKASDRSTNGKWEQFDFNGNDRTVTFESAYVIPSTIPDKGRIRVAISSQTAAASQLTTGCMRSDSYQGVVVDLTYKK